jgi:hypothetical protein
LKNENMFRESDKMPAHNKRFGEIGGEVIVRISLYPLTAGDSPNCAQSSPNFAKPPGRYVQAADSVADKVARLEKNVQFDNKVEN